MVLSVHTDASYLSKTGVKSRAAGHSYLSNCNDEDFDNCAILTLSTIIKHIMSSASGAKLATLYYGCKLANTLLWTTLEELGHFQPTPTAVTTNNSTPQGLTTRTMTPTASKSMDQCFHWLKCWNAQCQFQYLWHKGIFNCTNYFSKHHAPKHHQNVCPFLFLTILHSLNSDRTCLPSNYDSKFVIQCQHLGPLFMNSNTDWLSTCKGVLITQISKLDPYVWAK